MKLRINIDGKDYEVEVEAVDEQGSPESAPASHPVTFMAPIAAVAPPSPFPAAGAGAEDESKACRSPISGIVVHIKAQEGQQVKVNDPLLVLEAMKMETAITSPVNGTIKKYRVAGGDSVQSGQVLVDFE